MSLGVGEILSDTFSMVRNRIGRLTGLYLVWFAIMIAYGIVAALVLGGGMMAAGAALQDPNALGGLGVGFIVMMILFYIGYIVIASAQNASMCTMASPLRSGDFGEAMSAGIRAALPMFGVMVLLLLGYFAIFAVVGVLAAALGTAGAVIGYLAALVLLIWLGARIGIVMAVVPIDGVRNPLAAIGRAWSLTAGNAVPIAIAFIAFMLIGGVAIALPLLPLIGAAQEAGSPGPGLVIFAVLALIVIFVLFIAAYTAMISAIHARLVGATDAAETFE